MVVVIALLVGLRPPVGGTHPGEADEQNGHTCTGDCERWGLEAGEYHRHNREGAYGNRKGQIFDAAGALVGALPAEELGPQVGGVPPTADVSTVAPPVSGPAPPPSLPARAPTRPGSRRIRKVRLPDCRLLFLTENLLNTLLVRLADGSTAVVTEDLPPPPGCRPEPAPPEGRSAVP